MRQYFIHIALILAFVIAGATNSFANSNNTLKTDNTEQASKAVAHDAPVKSTESPISAKSHIPVEKSHSQVPTWDELAHIHHFHKNRLKKIKRHFKKSVFLSKLLLFLCHAAVLYISFLHLTH
ncbi:MAG: hypothetical protein KBF82_03235 [Chitinophagaceae bacterium]|nr:hypothetical protein [Chitinophagaceae bacterium]